jgi:large subunit ribosomal protein L3
MVIMRKGSLEFWPHRRAKKQMPRMRTWPKLAEPGFAGLVAVKAGMTHITMIDDSDSPSKGSEISRAVTILEIPRIQIYGIRAYKKNYVYTQPFAEVYDVNLAKKVGINKIEKNDIAALKSQAAQLDDVTALAFCDHSSLEHGNKNVMRFEIHLGGKTNEEKLAFAEKWLGKELHISDVLGVGDYIDVNAISKGKGWAGVIKRFHVARQYRKATGKVRHVGVLGPWHPAKVMFSVPHPGHMGYNYRTEINKRVLKMGTGNDASSINVSGGFVNFGTIKNDYIMVDGSVPGPAKRLLRIRKSIRLPAKGKTPQITYVSLVSKQGA